MSMQGELDALGKLLDIRLELYNMYCGSSPDREGFFTEAIEAVNKLMLASLDNIKGIIEFGEDLDGV